MSATTRGQGWAYAGAVVGGLVSIAANIAHSYVPPVGAPADWRPPLGAVVGAVFWPVALFLAIEVLVRTPWPDGGWWVFVRFAGLLPVAVVAAFVSYNHLSGLLAHYGESQVTAHIGPLAVDGLMIMASAALMAIAQGRMPETVSEAPAVEEAPALAPTTPPVAAPPEIPLPTAPIEKQEQVRALLDQYPSLKGLGQSALHRRIEELCAAASVKGPSPSTVRRALVNP